jgi:hypothetical protein
MLSSLINTQSVFTFQPAIVQTINKLFPYSQLINHVNRKSVQNILHHKPHFFFQHHHYHGRKTPPKLTQLTIIRYYGSRNTPVQGTPWFKEHLGSRNTPVQGTPQIKEHPATCFLASNLHNSSWSSNSLFLFLYENTWQSLPMFSPQIVYLC